MKISLKPILFAIVALISTTVSAQWTSLVVFAPKGEKFTLYFNGNRQNSEPASRVQVDEVHGPTCKVRLVFDQPGPELSKTIFNKLSSTMYYAVQPNAKGNMALQSVSSEWSEVPAESSKKEKAAAPTSDKPAQDGKKSGSAGGNSKKGCSAPMSEGDFIAGLVSVSTPPFDPPKLSAAKKLALAHCLTTAQVKQVMYTFDNESTRLTFAKFAYDYTWDLKNYTDVGDALHSSRSKDELEQFINTKK